MVSILRCAHSLLGEPEELWEPLSKHLANVASRAEEFARPFGAEKLAAVAGLLHDIGKCSTEYQAYIRGEGPSPDHSTAGAIEAVGRFRSDAVECLLGRLIAYAVAGHHAGLTDGSGPGAASLDSRLVKPVPSYPGWQEEAIGLPERLPSVLPIKGGTCGRAYTLAFLGRMLFSCLVDADFRLVEDGEPIPPSTLPAGDRDRDLGWMLHDINFATHVSSRSFRARLANGVLEVAALARDGVTA